MIRGTYLFFLLMTLAIASGAGEIRLDSASSGNKTGIVPPVVNENFEYYEVCGTSEKDVQTELGQKCIRWTDGKKYDSATNWKVKWDYGHSRAPQTCSTESFVVTVDIVYHLPKWVRTGDESRPLIVKWDSYIEKLMMHERGHRDRAVDAAIELTRAVAELPPARTCTELDRIVNTLCRTRLDKLMEDQKVYDCDTNHGVLQGAVFP